MTVCIITSLLPTPASPQDKPPPTPGTPGITWYRLFAWQEPRPMTLLVPLVSVSTVINIIMLRHNWGWWHHTTPVADDMMMVAAYQLCGISLTWDTGGLGVQVGAKLCFMGNIINQIVLHSVSTYILGKPSKKKFRRKGQCPFLGEGGSVRKGLSLSQNECFWGVAVALNHWNWCQPTCNNFWHHLAQ